MFNANRRQRTYILITRQARARESAERRPRSPWLRMVAEGLAGLGASRAAPATWPEQGQRLADGRDPRW